MKFFEPVIFLLTRLKYIQSFSFIGIILGVPIIVSSFMFVYDISEEMTILSERQKGVNYNKLLKELLHDTQQYRGFSTGYLNGNTMYKSKMDEKQDQIFLHIDEISEYDEAVCDTLNISKLEQIQSQWDTVLDMIQDGDLNESIHTQNQFISEIIHFMTDIGEKSGLIFSKTHYTYYMIEHIIKVLPKLTEELGQVRSLGMVIISKEDVTVSEKEEFASHLYASQEKLHELDHGMKVMFFYNPSLEETVGKTYQQVLHKTESFLEFSQTLLFDEESITISSDEYFKLATEVIDTHFELYDKEFVELNTIIKQQIDSIKWKRAIMIFLTGIALILTAYCFVGFYYSVRNTIEDVKTTGYLFLYQYLFYPFMKKAESKRVKTEQKLHETEKKLSQRVLRVQEEERKTVSRELHDGIGQSLYSILVILNLIERDQTVENKVHIENAKNITVESMNEVRRIAHSLRPNILDDLGFTLALKSYIDDFKKTHQMDVELNVIGKKERLDSVIEIELYRICQEALTNIAKHAKASLVKISIMNNEKVTSITIQDNGVGFNLNRSVNKSGGNGIGLLSMKERAEGIGGTFKIRSGKEGTKITVQVPKN